MFTSLNRLKNTLSGDLQLSNEDRENLSFGFEHFIVQSIRQGEQFNPQLLEDRLKCMQRFIDVMEKVPTGRAVKFEHRYNGLKVRAIKSSGITFDLAD